MTILNLFSYICFVCRIDFISNTIGTTTLNSSQIDSAIYSSRKIKTETTKKERKNTAQDTYQIILIPPTHTLIFQSYTRARIFFSRCCNTLMRVCIAATLSHFARREFLLGLFIDLRRIYRIEIGNIQ